MTPADAPLTVDWMVRQYGFDRAEVEQWLRLFRFNWPLSVKATDDCMDEPLLDCLSADAPLEQSSNQAIKPSVVGLLNMSDYRIEQEAEEMPLREPQLLRELNSLRYTAVFSFIVAPQYRGTRLNYDMLMSVMPELRARYDFVFIPVMHRLKTHQYWQRWGAREFWRDADCVYYMLEL